MCFEAYISTLPSRSVGIYNIPRYVGVWVDERGFLFSRIGI